MTGSSVLFLDAEFEIEQMGIPVEVPTPQTWTNYDFGLLKYSCLVPFGLRASRASFCKLRYALPDFKSRLGCKSNPSDINILDPCLFDVS